MKDSTPCAQWAEKLTVMHSEDLSSSEDEAFNRHLAECSRCAATRERYHLMAARVRALPAIRPLPDLTPQFLDSRKERDIHDEQIGSVPSSAFPKANRQKGQSGKRTSRETVGTGLAALVVTIIVLTALLLFQRKPLVLIAFLIRALSPYLMGISLPAFLLFVSIMAFLALCFSLAKWVRKGIGTRRVLPMLAAVSIGVVIVTLFSTFLYVPTAVTGRYGVATSQMVHNELIGISDGTYAFDVNRPDGNFKRQASEKFKQGDRVGALLLWREAVTADTNDAEALIYLENQRVLASGGPYLTLVIGISLSESMSGVADARSVLQGAYIAQKEYNDNFRLDGRQLLLLIANTGSQVDSAALVAQQIVQVAAQDRNIVGVMGWPNSAQSLRAIDVLSAAHIPMVSPTASSDTLIGKSPFFFSVVPSDQAQAIVGAKYAEQQLDARRAAIFVDPSDPYSESLAHSFRQQFTADGNQVVATEIYKIGQPQALPALLQTALSTNPDLIYFAGYPSDLSVLLTHLSASLLSANLRILGGDALYELGGYTSSALRGFAHLSFTAFAFPDEWAIQGRPSPSFFSAYQKVFAPKNSRPGMYGYSRPTSSAILAYDAMLVLLQGCKNVLDTGSISVTPEALQQGLREITGNHAIQGVSGQISFGSDGTPRNKAILVLSVDSMGYIRLERMLGCFTVCSVTFG